MSLYNKTLCSLQVQSLLSCAESHLRCSLVGVCLGEEKRRCWKRRAKEDLQNKEKVLFLSAVSLSWVLPQSATVYIPAVVIDKAANGVMTEIIWWSWEQLVPVSASLFSARSVQCLPEASWGFIRGRHDISALLWWQLVIKFVSSSELRKVKAVLKHIQTTEVANQ